MPTKWIATDEAVAWFDGLSGWGQAVILLQGLVFAVVSLIFLAIDMWIQASYDYEKRKTKVPPDGTRS